MENRVSVGREYELTQLSQYLGKALACSQKAKSLELRCATNLARLLRTPDRAMEGREILSECYSWFTEGLAAPDLQQARALLHESEQKRALVAPSGGRE